jgi:hypothetical protein
MAATLLASLAAIEISENTELRDLDVAGWDCANKSEGTAQSQDARGDPGIVRVHGQAHMSS